LAARTTFSRISGKLRQPSAKDDFRIDDYQFLRGVLGLAQVNDRNPFAHADLLRSETDALGSVHGLEHVGHQLTQLCIEFGHRLAGLLQHWIRKLHDLTNHFCL
jgi:hypothetical protein